MAQAAFAAGVQVAFLSAADERAGGVYERVGFRRTRLRWRTAMAVNHKRNHVSVS